MKIARKKFIVLSFGQQRTVDALKNVQSENGLYFYKHPQFYNIELEHPVVTRVYATNIAQCFISF